MADFPVVPLDNVQAQFNIDMIGRNRDDNPSEANTVYVIGADRISTDLHNCVVETNAHCAKPMTLDFEFNDPADSNSFYTRSDHYSYAVEGHPDRVLFHRHASRLPRQLRLPWTGSCFPKLVRIAQLDLPGRLQGRNAARALERDNQGATSGPGFSGPPDRSPGAVAAV